MQPCVLPLNPSRQSPRPVSLVLVGRIYACKVNTMKATSLNSSTPTGFNSIRTLAARLHYFQAISGNRLACLPLELRLRGKSTRQSHGTPIFYVDLTVRGGMDIAEMLQSANELETQRQSAGFDQVALDEAARRGFSNGAFEDNEEDSGAVIEEFFSSPDATAATELCKAPQTYSNALADKLEALATQTH